MFFLMFMMFLLYIWNFNFKLLALLILEGIMISMICLYFNSFFDLNSYLFMGFIIFCVFMVLDSVLGLSNLISSFRNSSMMGFFFLSF